MGQGLALFLVPNIALMPRECWVDVLLLRQGMLTFDSIVVPKIGNGHDHSH